MALRWERAHNDLYLGLPEDQLGQPLVQVAHVFSANGDDLGWMVLLVMDQGELFDHYETPREAIEAAEAAVDPDGML